MAGVIKNQNVREAATAGLAMPAQGRTGGDGGAEGAAARIVEHGPDSVIVEVTCACGRKTLLRCDYQETAK